MAKVLVVARDFFAQAACHKARDVQPNVVDARAVGHRKPALVANDFVNAFDNVLVVGSDANYVASFMRSDDMLPTRKTTKSIIRAIIGNISIQALCVSPSKAYLDVIRKIVSMYE